MKEKKSSQSGISRVCSKCGKRVLSIYTVSDSETTVCFDCFKKYYYRCSKCGKIKSTEPCRNSKRPRLPPSDSYMVYYDVESKKNLFICDECQEKNRAIYDSAYTPRLKFHADELMVRFFGVELEADRGKINDTYENREGHAYNVLSIANKNGDEENMYVKFDNSLKSGFEMVTHPMTLNYHMNKMPWKEIMSYLTDMGYLSQNTDTCGLHIHVNRSFFGYSGQEQYEAIFRLIYFTEKNMEKLIAFSRRTEKQFKHWADRYGEREKPEDYANFLKYHGDDKYRTINLAHSETVEFRLYKGTLNYNTFIAALQMTNELCKIAVINTDEEVMKLSWNDFIKGIDPEKNKELMQYLKKLNLYGEKRGDR